MPSSKATKAPKRKSDRLYGSHKLDQYIDNHYLRNKAVAAKKRFSYFLNGTKEYSPTLSRARKALTGVSPSSLIAVSAPATRSNARVTTTPAKQERAIKSNEPQVILATDDQGREYAVNLATRKIARF